MVKLIKLTTLFLLSILVASCGKKLIYFQEKEDSKNKYNSIEVSKPENPRDHIIEAGDVLGMRFTSSGPEMSILLSGIGTGLIVQENGSIYLPYSGSLKISGISISVAQKIISSELEKYLVNPEFELTLNSFRVTILGDINSPGIKNSPGDKMTIIDLISIGGDLTAEGNRKNIKVIRQIGDKKTTVFLDMSSIDVFRSEVYYLKSNDIVYVEPLPRKFIKENYLYVTMFLTIINTLVIFIKI